MEDVEYPERRLLQLQMRNIQVDEVGFAGPPFWLHVKLLHPRPGIADEKVILEIDEPLEDLQEGVPYENRPLHKRLLMKEIVEGPFSLVVMLSETKEGEIPGSLIRVIRETSTEIGKRVIEGITVRTIRAYIDLFKDLTLKRIEGVSPIAMGYVEMNTTQTDRSLLTVDLKATQDLHNPAPARRKRGNRTVMSGDDKGTIIEGDEDPDVLKQQGEDNGVVTFDTWIVDR